MLPVAVSIMLIEPAGPSPLKTLGTTDPVPVTAGQPVAVRMVPPVAGGSLSTISQAAAVSRDLHHVVVGAQRDGEHAELRARRSGCS